MSKSWIPALPPDWQRTKLRHVARIYAGGTPDRDNLEMWRPGEVPWLNSGAVNQNVVRSPSEFVSYKAANSGATRWVPRYSVIVALAGQGRTKGMAARTAIGTTVNQSLAAIVPEDALEYRYLHYWLQTNYLNMRALAGGDLRDGLNLEHIGSISIPLPSMTEQRFIADYLDHETAEIDGFIADQKRLADLAHEYQWTRLSSVVNYPEEFASLWNRSEADLVSLKHLGTITLGKMLDTVKPGTEEYSQQYLRAANVQPMGVLDLESLKSMRFTEAERTRLDLQAGDVVIVEGGVGGYGRAGYLKHDLPNMGFQNSIIRFRPHQHVDGRFVAYALLLLRRMGYIEAVASVASMPHFTAEKVAETPIPIVNLDKQQEIANDLDDAWQGAANLYDDLHQAIDLAHERRAALISAAVTGLIDVTEKHKSVAEYSEEEVGVSV